MSENSKIEWTDHTFNPWEGCQKVGPGCDHCYAETRNARFGGGVAVNWGPGAPRRRTSKANWMKPIRWNDGHDAFFAEHGRRQRVFCASLADVFDNAVDPQWRDDLWELIWLTPNLDWLLLTKRIGNVLGMLPEEWGNAMHPEWPNVWIGATVVNQEEADRDIPKLLEVPAAVRFLSIEPMLGPINIARWLDPTGITCMDSCDDEHYVDVRAVDTINHGGEVAPLCPNCGAAASWTEFDDGVDWVICGGESGHGARPPHPDWVYWLRDQCAAARVPFLFKQWGEWLPGALAENVHFDLNPRGVWVNHDGAVHDGNTIEVFRISDCNVLKVGKQAAGRQLDGRTHDEFPASAV